MKILSFNFNGVLDEVEEELVRRGHTILPFHLKDGKLNNWKKADVIIVWNESELGGWRGWIEEVKKAGKRVILFQHGRKGVSRIYPPFNEALLSDEVFVWGENDKIRLIESGVPEDKIRVTGTPILKRIVPRKEHEGVNVVFSPEHWDIDVLENAIVMGQLNRVRGVKVISKILEGEHNPAFYTNPVVSNRMAREHIDICAEVLSTADVVVSVSESTFELMAQALDIPVIIADIWTQKACGGDERYKDYYKIYSNAVTRVKDLTQLQKHIDYAVKHPEHLRKERADIVVGDGGIDVDDPVKTIATLIEKHE